jgi:hypothetical protein
VTDNERSLAARIRAVKHLNTAPCVRRCGRMITADPSLCVSSVCECGVEQWPRRLASGIDFVERQRGVA